MHDASHTDDHGKVGEVLEGLINYTVSHFAFEEELLEQHSYPLIKSHKTVHQNFIKRIGAYRDKHQQGVNVAKQLSGELQIWLTNHIKNEDADYVESVSIKEPSGSGLKGMLKKFFG